MNRQKLGELGEEVAAAFLMNGGYRILCRNFRCRAGEIDIIAMKGYNLIFVEVKTRRTDTFGRPCESVTGRKKGHMKTAAKYYLSARPKGSVRPQNFSFDVVEVEINHIKNVI